MSDSSDSNVTPVAPIAPVKPVTGIDGIPPIAPLDVPPPATIPAGIKNKKALPFFLAEVKDPDLMKNRGPAVEATNVIPIIDGEAILTEFEAAISSAKTSVLIAFWALDPEMKMVTDSNKTWGEMLLETAARGVLVRILWNDFDPGLQWLKHFQGWKRYMLFAKSATSLANDKFQIVCTHHEAEIPVAIMKAQLPGLYDLLPSVVRKNMEKEADALIKQKKFPKGKREEVIKRLISFYFHLAPGIWDKIKLDKAKGALMPKTPKQDYPAWPAAHHQKIIIVDGSYAYAGGLNITDEYLDTSQHLKKVSPNTKIGPWHDAFVKVEGSFAMKYFIDNYIGFWNAERKREEAFLKAAFSNLSLPLDSSSGYRPTTDLTVAMIGSSTTSTVAPSLPCQVRRTVSSNGMVGIPSILRKDILEGYLLAIQQAESYIYIENQYFREKEIGDAIIAQHKAKSDLRTIILLPRTAEELLKGEADALTKHGAALQHKILDSMTTSIRDKLGLFTPVRGDGVQVYVHSKLLLIDDKFASIGSANSNPRSYKVDTELDFVWYDETLVKKLREDLWNEVLGLPQGMSTWKPTEYVDKWSAIAKGNKVKKGKQKGFTHLFDNKYEGEIGNALLDVFT